MPLICFIYNTLLESRNCTAVWFCWLFYIIWISWTCIHIFRNKLWLTLSGILFLLLLFHKMTLLNRDFLGFVFAFMDSLSPHITTPVPLPKVCWSGNEVYSPLPLQSYHSIATLEWHCSVNLHICDALQWHFGGTLHCHSVITTPMVFSKYTPMPLRSVFGVLICLFATHSYATPMPLQCHSIRSEWHCSVHSGLWK